MWRHLSAYNDFVRLLINFELLTSNNFPIRLKLVLWKHCFKSLAPACLQHGCHLRQKPQKLSDTNGGGLRFAVSFGDGLRRRQWTNVEGWTGVASWWGFYDSCHYCYRKARIFRFLNDSTLEPNDEASECIWRRRCRSGFPQLMSQCC